MSASADDGAEALLGAPLTPSDVAIKDLGRALLPSPVARHLGDSALRYVGAADKVLLDDAVSAIRSGADAGGSAIG